MFSSALFFFSCLQFLVRSSCPSAYMLTTSWRTMHVRVRTFFSNSHSAHKYVHFYPTSTPSTEYILPLSLSFTLSNSHSLSLPHFTSLFLSHILFVSLTQMNTILNFFRLVYCTFHDDLIS